MTLQCKPRRLPHTISAQPTQKLITHQGLLQVKTQTNVRDLSVERPHKTVVGETVSLSLDNKQDASKENTGASFLQRLLDIERKHDERKFYNTSKNSNNTMKEVASQEIDNFNDHYADNCPSTTSKSPTRWLSEQIFDDSASNHHGDQWADYRHNKRMFYRTPYPNRLASIDDAQHTSSVSSLADSSLASLKTRNNVNAPINSMPNFSLLELQQNSDTIDKISSKRKRPLRLPPIFLPPIYSVRPRPLKERDFLTPTRIRGPITDEEWEDLRQCRYIRPGPPRFHVPSSSSELSLM